MIPLYGMIPLHLLGDPREMKIVPDNRHTAFGSSLLEGVSNAGIDKLAQSLGVDFNTISRLEFVKGLKEELEHKDITKGDLTMTAKIALAHLKELPDYYTRLDKMKEEARREKSSGRMDKLIARTKPQEG